MQLPPRRREYVLERRVEQLAESFLVVGRVFEEAIAEHAQALVAPEAQEGLLGVVVAFLEMMREVTRYEEIR